MSRFLPRTVVVLGFVSLLNDTASEMIAPLLPLFLTATLGTGAVVVGFIEGMAESTASLLKLFSGRLADRGWNHKRLVLGGYGLSNSARPLIGIALTWGWVAGLRFLDRVGKGLRTAPRDALIAAAVATEHRGRAFGFHRGLDHAGAMIGPLAAFALLQGGAQLRHVFELSVIPGLAVVLLLGFGLPDTPPAAPAPAAAVKLRWHSLDHRLRALIVTAGTLALATIPEAFLVLWTHGRGMRIAWIPLLWAAAHGIKMVIALPAGVLSDRVGRLPVVATGWGVRVAVLILLALAGAAPALTWGLFFAYSAALAFTEGAERALIGDFAPAQQKATAFGLYHMVNGLLALPGGLLFGALWEWVGVTPAFLVAATLTALSAATLVSLGRLRA